MLTVRKSAPLDIAVRMVRPQQPELLTQRIGMMRYALYAAPEHAALPDAARRFLAYDHHYQQQPHHHLPGLC